MKCKYYGVMIVVLYLSTAMYLCVHKYQFTELHHWVTGLAFCIYWHLTDALGAVGIQWNGFKENLLSLISPSLWAASSFWICMSFIFLFCSWCCFWRPFAYSHEPLWSGQEKLHVSEMGACGMSTIACPQERFWVNDIALIGGVKCYLGEMYAD